MLIPCLVLKIRRYLSGNFAPIHSVQPLTRCEYSGILPEDLAGGEYVRNGGNPVTNEALGRDAHWFDGDGMLSGVAFRRDNEKGTFQPEFVNQYVLTDVYLSTVTSPKLETPILPSITTLVNPLSSLITIILRIFRTLALVTLSHLPGSKQAIKKISVANTSILYHDGRALATCESGPPMRVMLPDLQTVGWFNGRKVEGESDASSTAWVAEGECLDTAPGFGGTGMLSFMKEWTTAHPRVDPKTFELLLFHSTFAPPYIHYSVVAPTNVRDEKKLRQAHSAIFNTPVPGVESAKMMHDFGVSSGHTIIMDLPLSLDPLNLAKGKPVVAYDPTQDSRFGVFPRYKPEKICWYETNACCIFHTANSWDSVVSESRHGQQDLKAVNMLACRLTSASLVFSAGDLAAPIPTHRLPARNQEEEQCRLYYYQFIIPPDPTRFRQQPIRTGAAVEPPYTAPPIEHQWALAAIPFEFPCLRDSASMSAARYVYGCSVSGSSFGAALGRATKINSLVKIDVKSLIEQGRSNPPTPITGCVDTRSIAEILASKDPMDPIKVFMMPQGFYAQEPRFVPRKNGVGEDDGWLLSYVFDESQLGEDGECRPGSKSELWVINARNMTNIVATVQLPQRVPYGLHGTWFPEEQILSQRPVDRLRTMPNVDERPSPSSPLWKMWMKARESLDTWLA